MNGRIAGFTGLLGCSLIISVIVIAFATERLAIANGASLYVTPRYMILPVDYATIMARASRRTPIVNLRPEFDACMVNAGDHVAGEMLRVLYFSFYVGSHLCRSAQRQLKLQAGLARPWPNG